MKQMFAFIVHYDVILQKFQISYDQLYSII
jgi:hypothetical protein